MGNTLFTMYLRYRERLKTPAYKTLFVVDAKPMDEVLTLLALRVPIIPAYPDIVKGLKMIAPYGFDGIRYFSDSRVDISSPIWKDEFEHISSKGLFIGLNSTFVDVSWREEPTNIFIRNKFFK